MAVPFALPDDDGGNAALEQIFSHIHDLLRLLQQQMQARQAREEVGASSRGKVLAAAAAAAGPVASFGFRVGH